MKTEIKNISQCVRELTITVPAKDAQKEYGKTLGKFKKFVSVPGFRKGKAPLNMIERMFGNHVREEFMQDQIEAYYRKATTEQDLKAIIPGEPVKYEWNKGEDFVATYRYEVAPEIDIKQYEGLEIPFEAQPLTEEAVDSTILEMQKKAATYEESDDEIIKDDEIEIELTIADSEKTVTRTVIVGDNQFGEIFNDDIIGTKVGQKLETKVFSGENQKDAHVKVVATKHLILPNLDDEFAKDLDFETYDAFVEDVRKGLQTELDQQNKQQKIGAIIEALIKANPFELPKKFLQQYALDLAEQYAKQYKMPTEQLLPLYAPIAEQQMKRFYIIEALKSELNIEINDEDKDIVIKEGADSLNISVEDYKEKYASTLESDDFVEGVKEQKVLKLVEDAASFVPYPKEEEKPAEEENKE